MNSNHHVLEFPFEFVNDLVRSEKYKDPVKDDWHWIYVEPDEALTTDAISCLNTVGVNDFRIQFFYGPADASTSIHEDAKILSNGEIKYGSHWTLNIVWGSEHSEMYWYKELNQSLRSSDTNSVSEKDAGVKYRIFNRNDVELIETATNVKIVLAKITVPHSVTNFDKSNARRCISVRESGENWTWEEAVEHFKPWIIE